MKSLYAAVILAVLSLASGCSSVSREAMDARAIDGLDLFSQETGILRLVWPLQPGDVRPYFQSQFIVGSSDDIILQTLDEYEGPNPFSPLSTQRIWVLEPDSLEIRLYRTDPGEILSTLSVFCQPGLYDLFYVLPCRVEGPFMIECRSSDGVQRMMKAFLP